LRDIDYYLNWYSENRYIYEKLTGKVKEIIIEILNSRGISFHTVQARTKSIESFRNKILKGIHYNPKEMQDLAGIRIITYYQTDVKNISEIIEKIFQFIVKRMEDKSDLLGINKVGYRSTHFVCTLPEERTNLWEFQRYKGLIFEIQLRTILQHTWAEVNYDRNYKYGAILPSEIKRRFSLLAGVLEVVDREFETILNLIDNYSNEVKEKTLEGNLDIQINAISLKEYLIKKFIDIPKIKMEFGESNSLADVAILELSHFKINTIRQLSEIFPPDYVSKLKNARIINDDLGTFSFADIIKHILYYSFDNENIAETWTGWKSISQRDKKFLKTIKNDI